MVTLTDGVANVRRLARCAGTRREFLMRILVLGGDGFCGWPTSLHLSANGHDVTIVDNFARRNADVELEAMSLTPIAPLGTRLAAWKEATGREIGFRRLDIAEDYR